MSDKITVKDFVEGYLNLEEKEQQLEYVKGHVIRKYAPVLEKRVVLQTLLNKSIAVSEFGVEYLDLFISRINMVWAILILYTDIDTAKKGGDETNAFEDYDLLIENDLIEIISNIIGERELKELLSLNNLIIDAYEKQNTDLNAFVTKQVNRLGNIIGGLSEKALNRLADLVDDTDKMNVFVNRFGRVLDRIGIK